MWLFRTNPSIPAQNSATFLWLTSATELSASFFFFPQLPDLLQKKIIILTKKKCTTNRIAYISVHKTALCYRFIFLLFSCSLLHLLCLPSSVIITSLCYVSRKILLWTISLYFYIWEGCLAHSWSSNNKQKRIWHTHQDCKLDLQRNGIVSGENFHGVQTVKISESI